jgi:hypothetical protein
MTYDFINYSVKCDSWIQIKHLSEIAELQGLKSSFFEFNENEFNEGCKYFTAICGVYVMQKVVSSMTTEIHYSELLKENQI